MSKVGPGKINSHNEWDTIKEIIVGSGEGLGATIEWHSEEKITEETMEKAYKLCKKASPQWFVDEINEDLENLSNTLKDFGAKVHRPKVHDISKIYSSPFWSSSGNNIYWDGYTSTGIPASQGIYYYTLNFKDKTKAMI